MAFLTVARIASHAPWSTRRGSEVAQRQRLKRVDDIDATIRTQSSAQIIIVKVVRYLRDALLRQGGAFGAPMYLPIDLRPI